MYKHGTQRIVLEANADKNKYMIMSRDQHAGQNYILKRGNKSFNRLEHFRYLGTNQRIQNLIREEIKSRLNSWNASYHSVQNLLFSSLLSKHVKIN